MERARATWGGMEGRSSVGPGADPEVGARKAITKTRELASSSSRAPVPLDCCCPKCSGARAPVLLVRAVPCCQRSGAAYRSGSSCPARALRGRATSCRIGDPKSCGLENASRWQARGRPALHAALIKRPVPRARKKTYTQAIASSKSFPSSAVTIAFMTFAYPLGVMFVLKVVPRGGIRHVRD